LQDKVQAAIQSFAGYGRLKRLALMIIAYRATNEEIGYLRKMFERFDLNNDGEITCEEFKKVLVDYEYTDLELESMFRAVDLDGTGLIHYRYVFVFVFSIFDKFQYFWYTHNKALYSSLRLQ
jgi:Ca2+-binding EF-hand superfamily protein